MLFSELCKIVVNKVTFVGFMGAIGAIPQESATGHLASLELGFHQANMLAARNKITKIDC